MSLRNLRRVGIGMVVSGVCLYFVLRGVDWGQVWVHLSEVDLLMFSLSMLLMLAAYFLMSWRWHHLITPLNVTHTSASPAPSETPPEVLSFSVDSTQPRPGSAAPGVSLLNLYGKMMTGYFFNAFFPARGGDLVRAYLLSRRTGLRKTTVLATIVIEKALDGMALLVMLLTALLLLPPTGNRAVDLIAPDALAWIAGLGLIAAFGGMALFYLHSDRLARLLERIMGKLPLPVRLQRLPVRLVETFAGGMHVFRSPNPLFKSALISLLVWVVVALMFSAALASFRSPFPPELTGVAGLMLATGLVNLGLLVPALPGNVGTYEALVVAVMAFFRVDKELAVAFALVFHIGQLVTTLAVGIVAFWTQNLSLAEIDKVERAAEQDAESALMAESAPLIK